MLLSKKERFRQAAEAFGRLCCPACSQPLTVEEACLRCEGGHVWNINKKGFVNFLSRPVDSCYDACLFEARQRVFESGCYDPVLEGIMSLLPQSPSSPLALLDAGCGDGWYLDRLLTLHPDWTGSGIDISKDAILQAAGHPSAALWCVGDLRKPPYMPGSFDAVLDILTPASYDTFLRLLRPGGLLIKVYPGSQYLREIRQVRGLPLYEEGKVDRYMKEKVCILQEARALKTFPVTDELWRDFCRMTPLNQDLSPAALEEISRCNPGEITIDLHLASARALP